MNKATKKLQKLEGKKTKVVVSKQKDYNPYKKNSTASDFGYN